MKRLIDGCQIVNYYSQLKFKHDNLKYEKCIKNLSDFDKLIYSLNSATPRIIITS